MGNYLIVFRLILAFVISSLLWWASGVHAERTDEIGDKIIVPVPNLHDQDPQQVALGRRLFSDPRLSVDNSISCESCHGLESAGVDGVRSSVGVTGKPLLLNTPTVYNSRFNFVQFWDGRAATLEEQVHFPLHAEDEMGSNWALVIERIEADPSYIEAFDLAYPDEGVTEQTIAGAIAAFERSLVTPNSRFDRYLKGEMMAINEYELEGYVLFKTYGCASCHQGVNVGGNMFARMGLIKDYFADREVIEARDLGRMNITGHNRHRYVFKVPSLRNVELTAPYFHDGSEETLDGAVRVMSRYQLGRDIDEHDIELIVMFLKTLTGEFEHAN